MEVFPPEPALPAWPIVYGPSSHDYAEEEEGEAPLEARIGAGGEYGRRGSRLVGAKYHHGCVGRVAVPRAAGPVAVGRRGRDVRR